MSGCSVVRELLTDATHWADRGCNGKVETSRFQGLSEGNIGHPPSIGPEPDEDGRMGPAGIAGALVRALRFVVFALAFVVFAWAFVVFAVGRCVAWARSPKTRAPTTATATIPTLIDRLLIATLFGGTVRIGRTIDAN